MQTIPNPSNVAAATDRNNFLILRTSFWTVAAARSPEKAVNVLLQKSPMANCGAAS